MRHDHVVMLCCPHIQNHSYALIPAQFASLAVSAELLANTIKVFFIISELTPMWLSPLIRN